MLREQEGSASHALHHRSELDGWRTSLHENHLHHALSESNTADAAEHAVLPGDAHEAQPAQVETLHAHRQVEALLAAAHALGKPAPKQQPVTLADTAPAAAPLVPRSEKSLVLVGNGRSVLKHKLGDRIDGFDIVGRFNYFELGVRGHMPSTALSNSKLLASPEPNPDLRSNAVCAGHVCRASPRMWVAAQTCGSSTR